MRRRYAQLGPERPRPVTAGAWRCGVIAACVALLVIGSAGCGKGGAGPAAGGGAKAGGGKPAMKPVPVSVAKAERRDVPVEIRTFGAVEAFSTVAIKAQVSGLIRALHFAPGQAVKKGDALVTIDPRPFEIALREAEATLVRTRVQQAEAERQLANSKRLRETGVASDDELKKAQSAVEALQAAQLADQAGIERAKLELEYCRITSPLDARMGDPAMKEGSLVKENDAPIVSLSQVRPVYVTFSVPQVHLPAVRRSAAAQKLVVQAEVPAEGGGAAVGELTFIDTTVDPATGTIRLKAMFANETEQLWPGQYVNVLLTVDLEKGVVVVPVGAVQTGQSGQLVFVVKDDQTVEMRSVEVARTVEETAVIGRGLEPGETVVTDGQLRLLPGSRVEVRNGNGGSGGNGAAAGGPGGGAGAGREGRPGAGQAGAKEGRP